MNFLAGTLNENLGNIVTKLNELMDSFWLYIVLALAGVVVIWGAYVGIRIAVAHRNEEKINARGMVKSLIIGMHCGGAQERGKDQRAGYGKIARHRNYNHLRCGDGCSAAHQRSVGVGRLKLKLTGVGAA